MSTLTGRSEVTNSPSIVILEALISLHQVAWFWTVEASKSTQKKPTETCKELQTQHRETFFYEKPS